LLLFLSLFVMFIIYCWAIAFDRIAVVLFRHKPAYDLGSSSDLPGTGNYPRGGAVGGGTPAAAPLAGTSLPLARVGFR
ncbi:hypothetical protein, partial [Methylobacterium radiotolerans]|uniref:hypothetical protein n=1 Tax=Methylobacterium radiotolerans TaxID=31998 RepID=UPI001AECC63B